MLNGQILLVVFCLFFNDLCKIPSVNEGCFIFQMKLMIQI